MERVDVYLGIHKALRAVLFDVVAWVGRTDFRDEGETEEAAVAVRRALGYARDHGYHEDHFIFDMLREREPGLAAEVEEDHGRLAAQIRSLRDQVELLEQDLDDRERKRIGDDLHRALTRFVGDYLLHMHREETEVMRALWAHFTDQELLAMHGRMLNEISPMRFAEWAQVMLPAMNPDERAFLADALEEVAPEPIYQGFTVLAEQVLGDLQWWAVQQRLGMAAK